MSQPNTDALVEYQRTFLAMEAIVRADEREKIARWHDGEADAYICRRRSIAEDYRVIAFDFHSGAAQDIRDGLAVPTKKEGES